MWENYAVKGNRKRRTFGYLAQTTFSDDNAIVQEELQKAFGPLKKMEQDLQKLSEEMSENYSEDILNRYARMQQAFEVLADSVRGRGGNSLYLFHGRC